MNKMLTIFATISILISSSAFSNPYTYECDIKSEYTLSDDGALITSGTQIYNGKKFNVERPSGIVLGGGVGNSTYPTKTVIDPGGMGQSYKLLWTSREVIGTKGGKNAIYLTIQEYNVSSSKPFTMVIDSRILSGICN